MNKIVKNFLLKLAQKLYYLQILFLKDWNLQLILEF